MNFEDPKVREGFIYERLTVLHQSKTVTDSGRRVSRFWMCRCSCGSIIEVRESNLLRKHTKSCGCLRSETAGSLRRAHGESKRTAEHRIWKGMRERCENPKRHDYQRYGGSGIAVCERWQTFAAFLEDMGRRPTTNHTIERIDSNGPYAAWNCRWATQREQQNNKSSNVRLTYNGETLTLSQWAERIGIKPSTLSNRVRAGWSPEKAITTPLRGAANV